MSDNHTAHAIEPTKTSGTSPPIAADTSIQANVPASDKDDKRLEFFRVWILPGTCAAGSCKNPDEWHTSCLQLSKLALAAVWPDGLPGYEAPLTEREREIIAHHLDLVAGPMSRGEADRLLDALYEPDEDNVGHARGFAWHMVRSCAVLGEFPYGHQCPEPELFRARLESLLESGDELVTSVSTFVRGSEVSK